MRAIPSRTRSRVGASVKSRSPKHTRPASGSIAPEISRSAVVLPEPFGPTSATVSPGITSNERPSSATTPPKAFVSPSTLSAAFGPGAADLYGTVACDRGRRKRESQGVSHGMIPSPPSASTKTSRKAATAASKRWSGSCSSRASGSETSPISPRAATPTTGPSVAAAPPSSTATSSLNERNGSYAAGSATPASCTESPPASPASAAENAKAPSRCRASGTPSEVASAGCWRSAESSSPKAPRLTAAIPSSESTSRTSAAS